jgi:phosphoribosylglycinamide formyltransferase-1
MIRLVVLLSGRGSNFAAIHDAIVRKELDATIVSVISNRGEAPGIARAREWGYPAHVIDNRDFPDRAAHEREILHVIEHAKPDFIVLAGYMRLLSSSFVAAYRNRIVNIHPSLLPAFPGVDAQAQALAHGVKVSGCTVHFVDESLDGGPIIVQRCVDVHNGDTVESLSARILEQEHIAYVDALKILSAH